jgi:hypothetical protein
MTFNYRSTIQCDVTQHKSLLATHVTRCQTCTVTVCLINVGIHLITGVAKATCKLTACINSDDTRPAVCVVFPHRHRSCAGVTKIQRSLQNSSYACKFPDLIRAVSLAKTGLVTKEATFVQIYLCQLLKLFHLSSLLCSRLFKRNSPSS